MDQSKPSLRFDERFLDRYAGPIISDTAVAIVELVANAWDAFSTEVVIIWPNKNENTPFSIRDNGRGMSDAEFLRRWETLDYNRLAEEGDKSSPPSDLTGHPPRTPYGRNGKGRHAAFRFSDPYTVTTWKAGEEVTYEVKRGAEQPFVLEKIADRNNVEGHGTLIAATSADGVLMSADEAREIIGTRFLADPNFTVFVDGTRVTFEDIPKHCIRDDEITVPGLGIARIYTIDSQKADRTTRHHGIAWRVKNRLVGSPSWTGFDHDRILDGRTSEAKRFQFLVFADFLADAVQADWTSFDQTHPSWTAARDAVHAKIKEYLSEFSSERRSEAKAAVRERLSSTVRQLPPTGRDRWHTFVDEVVDKCPSISTDEIGKVAEVLANLELSTSKYGLIDELRDLKPDDLDALYNILTDWTVRLAKEALDEVQSRLQLINELDKKLRDNTMHEVGDLQPLFERSLWVFGPEFESLEFTSNRGMTTVIRKIFGRKETGSKQRPDFVMLPEGSAGFYSRDAHDDSHEVIGVAKLVIAEIKRPGIVIGTSAKDQAWRYVKELREKSLITEATQTTCYVLGSELDPTESEVREEWGRRVSIIPMSYETFVRRAERRMLGLRTKLSEAPFLKEVGFDAEEFVDPSENGQRTLQLNPP